MEIEEFEWEIEESLRLEVGIEYTILIDPLKYDLGTMDTENGEIVYPVFKVEVNGKPMDWPVSSKPLRRILAKTFKENKPLRENTYLISVIRFGAGYQTFYKVNCQKTL